ncbi:hypothetical protein Hte_001146 [Hypoxylon texense]
MLNENAKPSKTNCLKRLINCGSLVALESGVSIGTNLLDQLKFKLGAFETSTVDTWLKSIKKLKGHTEPSRTVDGVVGNTGADKSSIINAVLDEERLLPTNCLRAFTSSPIEISYNKSEDPAELYRSQVQFITFTEWLQELKILFRDLLDSNGELARDTRDPDSDAGIAYAKLKAVYPHKTREMIVKGTPEEFANDACVRDVLGSVKFLSAGSAKELYDLRRQQVEGSNYKKRSVPLEYWPLIKVVQIYTKAEALSTGAVIADLPGVQDPNAARAAVAENYMKSCTSLRIVAPITRAIDDKTAKLLLGDSFRRQLKYDGTYSARPESSRESAQSALKELKERKSEYAEQLEDIDTKVDTWGVLKTQLEHGKIGYSPSENSKKRRRRTEPIKSLKNDWDAYDDPLSDDNSSQSDVGRRPLTQVAIDETLASRAESERSGILADVKTRCIQGRNEYSREAVKQDIVKELDQEHAAEEDETTLNPEEDIRDYDEVARTLPVFCVSSRAYHKLSGRLQKDDFQSHGFMSLEDKGIPQLQQHSQKLTEARRASHCRGFLNELVQLISSMKLWTTSDGAQCSLTDVKKCLEEMRLRELLDGLEKGSKKSAADTRKLLDRALSKNIHRTLDSSIPSAIDAAVDIAAKWGAEKSSGGLALIDAPTRQPVHSKRRRPRTNFNRDLFAPIDGDLRAGAGPRLSTAASRPSSTKLGQAAQLRLKAFREAVRAGARSRRRANGVAGQGGAGHACPARCSPTCARWTELPPALRAIVSERQRQANGGFTPVICDAMKHASTVCTEERGSGSYNRMKAAMTSHVGKVRDTMFHGAVKKVKAELGGLRRAVQQRMDEVLESMFATIFSEYMQVLGLPKDLAMRAAIDDLLRRSDSLFVPALGQTTTRKQKRLIRSEDFIHDE